MESVDQEILRDFALSRFESIDSQSAVLRSYLRLLDPKLRRGMVEIHPDLTQQYGVPIIIERRGFFDIGKAIGFFPPQSSFIYASINIEEMISSQQEIREWPAWFSEYALNRTLPYFNLQSDGFLSEVDQSILSFFQAALILSSEFNELPVFYLQRALQDESSPLDSESTSVTGDDLWNASQLEGTGKLLTQPINNVSLCVAGLIELTKLLAGFDDLFLSEMDTDAEDFSDERYELVRSISSLLAWRLNLSDDRTRRRLDNLSEVFWELCRSEFERHSDLNLAFSETASRRLLATLLSNWRSRIDPEPELDGPQTPPRGHTSGGRVRALRVAGRRRRETAGAGA